MNLEIYAGEVHALVGENGAGKSTLMKILSGVIPAGDFGGQILLNGQAVEFKGPHDAEKARIAIIHQELSAFPHLTVAENIFAGHWPTQGPLKLIDWDQLYDRAQKALDRVGATFSAKTTMQKLSTGDQQMVEIAKALLRDSKILILDEPTSSLSPKESERLFALIKELRKEGKALVYISHRMEELFALSDRMTVLRDGSSIVTAKASELTEAKLITHMVGRDLSALYPDRPAVSLGRELLKVENFVARNRAGTKVVGPVSLHVRRGEILGFAGLLGAGRSEFLRALMGDSDYAWDGDVFYHQKKFSPKSPGNSFAHGMAWLSEDRKRESLLPTRNLVENTGIIRLNQRALLSLVNAAFEKKTTDVALNQLKTAYRGGGEQKITELSGGNQQKVILARILQQNPDLLILDEPTRGVDVGAKYEIYELLYKLVAQDKSILLVSSDLPELLALSDRVLVFSHGKVQGEVERADFSQEKVMQMAVAR